MTWIAFAAYWLVALCAALWLGKHMLQIDRSNPVATFITALVMAALWPVTYLTAAFLAMVVAWYEKATRPNRAASEADP